VANDPVEASERDGDLIKFRMTVCGVEELEGHARDAASPVTHILSLLNPGWPVPEGLAAFGSHRRLDLRFHDIIDPLPGMRPPAQKEVEALLAFGREVAADPGSHLLVHCEKGLSRSTAALWLMLLQAAPECSPADILAEIVRIRPRAWPNLRLVELGDLLLRQNGALIAAASAVYRTRLDGRPALAEAMIEMGRGRELALAQGLYRQITGPGRT
jgi:predicted protein tyrosine phosphatase